MTGQLFTVSREKFFLEGAGRQLASFWVFTNFRRP